MPHAHASGFPSPCNDRGGQAPALREKTPRVTVGRGPVPRHATIAGDRPPRYGRKNAAPSRRARACPSPSFAQSNNRGGNPLGCAYGNLRGPPRYDKKTVLEPSRGKPSRMRVWHPRAPRYGIASRPGGLSYGIASRPGRTMPRAARNSRSRAKAQASSADVPGMP